MSHTCHAHGCRRVVPARIFMCRTHWFSLRAVVRGAVWQEYRPGQERDKQASLRYLAVQQRAIGELVFKPGDVVAAAAATLYIVGAEVLRREAIDAGLGDPLHGISEMEPLSAEFAEALKSKFHNRDGRLRQ